MRSPCSPSLPRRLHQDEQKKQSKTKQNLLEGAGLSKPAGPKPFSFVSMKEEGEEAAFLPPTQDSGKLDPTRAALRNVPGGLQ